MARRLAAVVVTLLGCAAPAVAQDRLLQLGWLWDLSTGEPTRLRPMPELRPWSAVVVAGARFVVQPVPEGNGSARLGYLDTVTGAVGVVPGVSLDWSDPSLLGAPALAADPRRSRVFIWHGRTIVEASASSGLRIVVPDVELPSQRQFRRLAYSAAADVVMFPQPGQTDPAIDDIVVARAATGDIVRRFATVGTVSNLSADATTARVIITSRWLGLGGSSLNHTVQVFDAPDGSVTPLPYAPPFYFSGPALDETNHRLLFAYSGGVVATDDRGQILGQLTTGNRQLTDVTGVSPATGRTVVQSFEESTMLPLGACLLHVVERTGGARPAVDLSAEVGRVGGGCGGGTERTTGVLLAAPGRPGPPVATVIGSEVALSWTHPGNVEWFELEIAVGTAVFTVPSGQGFTAAFAGVPAGTYRVRVRGRNAIGAGAWSSQATVTVP